MENQTILGVIGGSGVYDIEGLTNVVWKKVSSSFGSPSDELMFGELNGLKIVFLPRHGRGHLIPPSEVNYQANIEILKKVGVTDIISVSAVGSLKEKLEPGCFVIVDQFIDRTFARKKSFFGTGLVAHVSMAHPVCNRLGDLIENSLKSQNIRHERGGTYIAMEGPQFSSIAESNLYRSWGCDVIGMTNMPEAKLAREAEMCYATVAMVTDFDCWHPEHDNVTVDMIIKTLLSNSDKAKSLVKVLSNLLTNSDPSECNCKLSLENALITSPERRDPKMLKQLKYIIKRVEKN
jgi:5'-methylthioadenosine phosphorylase